MTIFILQNAKFEVKFKKINYCKLIIMFRICNFPAINQNFKY